MTDKLSNSQLIVLVKRAVDAFPHDACLACECFLGYLARIELDSDIESQDFIKAYKPNRNSVHSCLGCDPCPPGDQFAEYLRENH